MCVGEPPCDAVDGADMCRSRGATSCKHCRVQASCSSSFSARALVAQAAGAALFGLPRGERGAAFAGPAWAAMGAQGRVHQQEQAAAVCAACAWQAGS